MQLLATSQHERETYRVIVFGREGRQVLLVQDSGRAALPWVEIPRRQRVAESLTAAVKTEWGEEVVFLFEPDGFLGTNGARIRYQATEHWQTCGLPRLATRWVPVSTELEDSLTEPSDYRAIRQAAAQSDATRTDSPIGPFARFGWFKELRDWVEAAIEPIGVRLTGPFLQLNASPSFSLVRFETDGAGLWFKAVGEPNQREFSITCTLAQLFPGYLPGLLRSHRGWSGWLMREVEGKGLHEWQETAYWERAAAALAELQIQSIGSSLRLQAAGARDLGAAELLRLICPFIETAARLMDQQIDEQINVRPSILRRKELQLVAEHIESAIEALMSLRIPDALGHLDLNPGNIVVSRERCAFLDWAEAYVGNLLFSFEYLLEHVRRSIGADSELEAKLIKAYSMPWEQVLCPAEFAEALVFAPLVAIFAYAVGSHGWTDEIRLKEPTYAGYLRSLTRRMHREASKLHARRSLCLD